MRKLKNWFIGDYLAKTEDVFERAKIELIYNFSIFFLFLGLNFYTVVILNHLHYQFYIITFGVLSLTAMPFILKYSENSQLAAWFWVTQQNVVAVGNIIVSEGRFDIMTGFWIMVMLLFSFFVFEKRSLIIASSFAFFDVALGITNILSGKTLLEFGIPDTEKLSDSPIIILMPFSINVYLVWQFTKTQRAAKKRIEEQRAQLQYKNKEVTDSITYAERIQKAILPSQQVFENYLPNSFVVYMPKDIVSGDFYWIEKKENKIFFAVADCTGHGVPGAMMSVIGQNILNRAVNEFGLRTPALILDKLNDLIGEAFAKSGADVRDGMDIALCSLDLVTNVLEFAAANNPLYIIDGDGLREIKASKQPIGRFENKKPFANHEIRLKKGDSVYLLSDGMADQFGGPQGKKFKYKQIKDLLQRIHDKPNAEQKNSIMADFLNWKGKNDQIDDVCLIGVKF
jgi:serine phosphatase RsbU (regulator of sigma subunit)